MFMFYFLKNNNISAKYMVWNLSLEKVFGNAEQMKAKLFTAAVGAGTAEGAGGQCLAARMAGESSGTRNWACLERRAKCGPGVQHSEPRCTRGCYGICCFAGMLCVLSGLETRQGLKPQHFLLCVQCHAGVY